DHQQFDGMAVFRPGHFSAVLLNEPGPLRRSLSGQGKFHGLKARRQVGEPDVKPVLRCKFGFGDTARRAADRPETNAFTFHSRAAEPHETYSHDRSFPGLWILGKM